MTNKLNQSTYLNLIFILLAFLSPIISTITILKPGSSNAITTNVTIDMPYTYVVQSDNGKLIGLTFSSREGDASCVGVMYSQAGAPPTTNGYYQKYTIDGSNTMSLTYKPNRCNWYFTLVVTKKSTGQNPCKYRFQSTEINNQQSLCCETDYCKKVDTTSHGISFNTPTACFIIGMVLSIAFYV